MIIEQINGDTISADRDVASYLNRMADNFTLLSLRDPKTDSVTSITVKPISLSDESDLLYRRWVKRNELEVDSPERG